MAWAAISRLPAPSTSLGRAFVNAAGIVLTQSFVILGFAFTSYPTLAMGVTRFLTALTWGTWHV
jgi:hypothetical protein